MIQVIPTFFCSVMFAAKDLSSRPWVTVDPIRFSPRHFRWCGRAQICQPSTKGFMQRSSLSQVTCSPCCAL